MHVVTLQGADSGGAAMLHDPIRTAGRLRERDDCIQACRSIPCLSALNPVPCFSTLPQTILSNVRHASHCGAPDSGQKQGGSRAGCEVADLGWLQESNIFLLCGEQAGGQQRAAEGRDAAVRGGGARRDLPGAAPIPPAAGALPLHAPLCYPLPCSAWMEGQGRWVACFWRSSWRCNPRHLLPVPSPCAAPCIPGFEP